MTHRHTKVAVLVVNAFLLFTLIAVAAVTFKFSPLKIPGAHASWAYGVNNSGVIVGQYFDANYVGHGFMLNEQGHWATIDPPDSTSTICLGINSSGAIVGEYTDQSNSNHGFLYENGTFTQIGEGSQSAAYGINDMGEIVGSYLATDGSQHAFLWDGQKYTQLDVPNAKSTGAVGINKQGVITLVATYYSPPALSFLYKQGKFTEIKVPGATQTQVHGINNFGDLALTWDDAKGIHGAIRYLGVFYKFDYTPNYTNVYGLNDYRMIVGDSFTSTAFKASFSIEPATVTPATAVFNGQAVATTSAPRLFSLTNDQTVALNNIVISTTGDFAVSSTTCTTSLAARTNCTIDVTFTPTATGTRTGQLRVSDNAGNSPQTSKLTGTGK